MSELDAGAKLIEDGADEAVPTDVGLLIGDEGEEVTGGEEVHDEEGVSGSLDGLVEREDGRVRRKEGVKVQLSGLEGLLARGEVDVGEDLDGYMSQQEKR